MLKDLLTQAQKLYLFLRCNIDETIARKMDYNHLELRLGGSYPEEPPIRPPFPIPSPSKPTLIQILMLLDEVRRDDRIKTLLLRIDPVSMGWSRLESIGKALEAIAGSGTKIFAYLERPGTQEYFLACHCHKIILPPTSTLNLMGLRAEVMFAKELLDRLEVKGEFLSAGKYKSAMEPYSRKDLSKPARENLDSILDDTFARITAKVATARKLKEEKTALLLGDGPYLASEAKKSGLVDQTSYRHELKKEIKKESGTRSIKAGQFMGMAFRRKSKRMLARPKDWIAVLFAEGIIAAKRSKGMGNQSRVITPGDLRRVITQLRKEEEIKAVVLRINSPGGDGLASDLIYQELLRLADKKPLVVSMGDVAASGGYYLAMAGQRVFAEPGTLTGSIGVIAGKMSLQGLYHKFGLRKTVLKRGNKADLFSDYVPLSKEGRQAIQKQIDFFYKDFVSKVAKGRDMKVAQAKKQAGGRVWTGGQALDVGLVDELGGLSEAISQAARLASLPEDFESVHEIHPKPRSWWKRGEQLVAAQTLEGVSGILGTDAGTLEEAAALALPLSGGAVCALAPYRIKIR